MKNNIPFFGTDYSQAWQKADLWFYRFRGEIDIYKIFPRVHNYNGKVMLVFNL
jgi:hypothetical protein